MTTPWRVMLTCLILYFPVLMLLACTSNLPARLRQWAVVALALAIAANTAFFFGAAVYAVWTFTE